MDCVIFLVFVAGRREERELVWKWNAAGLSIPFECCWYVYWYWNWNCNCNLCRYYLEVTVA
jgi:hypothetical protein